jgi:hypothetical protein
VDVFNWFRIRPGVAGFCEYGNEPSDSINDREFIDRLRDKSNFQGRPCTMELVS